MSKQRARRMKKPSHPKGPHSPPMHVQHKAYRAHVRAQCVAGLVNGADGSWRSKGSGETTDSYDYNIKGAAYGKYRRGRKHRTNTQVLEA